MKLRYTLSIMLLAISSTAVAQSLTEHGYDDGMNGIDMRYLSVDDFDQYVQGYNQGLREYCNVENAIKLGEQGKMYRGVCDNNDDSAAFKTAYDKAFERYQQDQWLELADRNWY